jgi:RNA polymerase sigma-70 factor (ECF subfamily)
MQEFVMLSILSPRRIGQQAVPSTLSSLPVDPTDAFELLYRRYSEPIASWLLRRLNGNQDLALDLRDEVFLRVWQALPSWHERGIDPKHWLYRIAHARLVDYYRRRKALTLLPEWEAQLPDPANATDHEIVQSDVARRVRLCVARLAPDQRAVIELRWFRSLSFHEIAKRMGKSEGAVAGLHHRGLVNLRELVQQGWFEAPFEQLTLSIASPVQADPPHAAIHAAPPQQHMAAEAPVSEIEQLSFFP